LTSIVLIIKALLTIKVVMKVKIDTREKMHVIRIHESSLAANMTEKMDDCLMPLLKQNVKNIVIDMSDIKTVDNAAARHLFNLQQRFIDMGASFLCCNLDKPLRDSLNELGILENLNTTPTISEASDIVMMEELAREFGEN
jgi:anti-anti-sigma regulatory factor